MYQIDQTTSCIVVVDDNEESLKYCKMALSRLSEGCCIKTFDKINNEFFEFIKEPRIDLFIIDIHLGEKSGIDLSNELLKIMSGLTFLFISGYDYSLNSFAQFDGKCIYDYMSKPIDFQELRIRVNALLNISKSYTRVIKRIETMKHDFHEMSVDNLRCQYFDQINKDKDMIKKMKDEMFNK